MRAWRFDLIRPGLLGLALLITGLLGPAALHGQSRTPRPPADSTEGFRVRVTETRSGQRSAPALPDQPDGPDVPVPPDVPDVPDYDGGENEIVRFGEDITIPADKVVDGDVVAIGGNVIVYGRVKGDVTSVGGTVELRGGGVIEGDAVSLGGGVVTTDSGSVTGSNVSIGTKRFWGGWGMMPMLGLMGVATFGTWLVSTLVKLVLTLFFAWIALLLWKNAIARAAVRLREQFGKSFLWGLLTMAGLLVSIPVGIISLVLLGAIAIVILCITIIGIPVAVLLAIALVLAIIGLFLGVIFLCFVGYLNGLLYLGQRILGARAEGRSLLVPIGVGLVVVSALHVAGKLAGLAGLMLFHPLSIAFSVAASALVLILTVAGLGAFALAFVQGGGLEWRSYNWGPLRRTHAPAPPAEPVPGAAPAATPPGTSGPAVRPPGAPPDGTSDAP